MDYSSVKGIEFYKKLKSCKTIKSLNSLIREYNFSNIKAEEDNGKVRILKNGELVKFTFTVFKYDKNKKETLLCDLYRILRDVNYLDMDEYLHKSWHIMYDFIGIKSLNMHIDDVVKENMSIDPNKIILQSIDFVTNTYGVVLPYETYGIKGTDKTIYSEFMVFEEGHEGDLAEEYICDSILEFDLDLYEDCYEELNINVPTKERQVEQYILEKIFEAMNMCEKYRDVYSLYNYLVENDFVISGLYVTTTYKGNRKCGFKLKIKDDTVRWEICLNLDTKILEKFNVEKIILNQI